MTATRATTLVPPARRSRLTKLRREFAKAPLSAWFGMVLVAGYMIVALFAPWIAPYGESQIFPQSYAPWGGPFFLGTDQLGRDILTRLIYGARNTIGIALVTTMLSFSIGVSLGLVAAIYRRWVDQILSRLVNVLMSIPNLIFALMMLSAFGSSIVNLIIILAVLDSTRVFRLSRAVAVNVVVMDFVEVARVRGENVGWLMWREILPNIMAPLVAEFGLRFCFVFLSISALSFLGVGIQPPTADWGSMVRENAALISYSDITPLLPAAAIALLTVAVNYVVDWILHRTSGLRDEL